MICTSAPAMIDARPNWQRNLSSFTESMAIRLRPTASRSFAAGSGERLPSSRPEAAAPGAGSPNSGVFHSGCRRSTRAQPRRAKRTATEESSGDLAASSVHEVDLSDEWAALAGQVETASFPGEAQTEEIALAEANRAAELAATELIGASENAEEQAREPEPEYVLELDAEPE